MHAGAETHVKLREAIPIHIVYFTSWVDANGGLHFRDDVYGLDAKQAAATIAKTPKRDGAKDELKEAALEARPKGVAPATGG